jgi:FAD binding domain
MKAFLLATLLCSALTLVEVAAKEQAAPVCKPIPGDKNWPADDVWKKELPNLEKAPPPEGNDTRPDFTVTAKDPADVIAAVKFAAKYNIRLSLFNSGHDFHGRCEASNGLLLNVGNLRGCRVHESFTPTPNGTEPVKYGQCKGIIRRFDASKL